MIVNTAFINITTPLSEFEKLDHEEKIPVENDTKRSILFIIPIRAPAIENLKIILFI